MSVLLLLVSFVSANVGINSGHLHLEPVFFFFVETGLVHWESRSRAHNVARDPGVNQCPIGTCVLELFEHKLVGDDGLEDEAFLQREEVTVADQLDVDERVEAVHGGRGGPAPVLEDDGEDGELGDEGALLETDEVRVAGGGALGEDDQLGEAALLDFVLPLHDGRDRRVSLVLCFTPVHVQTLQGAARLSNQ